MSALLLHLAFALGGGIGAVARHALTLLVTNRFPFSTLVVNVAGCLILGAASAFLPRLTGFEGEEIRRLVAGFCGGLTTFSSFAYQSLDLHRSATIYHAATNIVLSLVLCLAAFWSGHALVAALVPA
ncbi:MAG: CrcB family protein [Pseudomonadota bacterium]